MHRHLSREAARFLFRTRVWNASPVFTPFVFAAGALAAWGCTTDTMGAAGVAGSGGAPLGSTAGTSGTPAISAGGGGATAGSAGASTTSPGGAGAGGASAGGAGGMTNAGGANVGATGGAGTAGAAGGGTASCANPNWTYCEDFEKFAEGSVPDGDFTVAPGNYGANGGKFTIATSKERAVSGTQSVKFHVDTQGRVFLNTTKPFPNGVSAFYGRMMLYMNKLPGTAHFDVVSATGADAMNPAQQRKYLWGGQFGATMANYQPGDCYKHIRALVPPAGKWMCYEWKFDSPATEMHVWIDDVTGKDESKHGSLIKTGEGGGGCGVWTGPALFTTLGFGWDHYQVPDVDEDVWIDDLVIDDQRIGCPLP